MTGGLPWLSCRLLWRWAAWLKCLSEQWVCLVLAFFLELCSYKCLLEQWVCLVLSFFSELCYLFCSWLCVSGTWYSYFWYANIGFPVILNVLKEDHEDVELVRGSLETLVGALTPIETITGAENWSSAYVSELWSALSRNWEYLSSFELIGEYTSFPWNLNVYMIITF
jgi:hypothetical protein